jgi:DeoR/GlpR family transcriptional regulator of sugar metabolism
MLKDERKKTLVEIITKEKVVSIADLCSRLGVSHMTIWRDLGELANDGEIERIRGGAIARQKEPFDIPGNFKLSQDHHLAPKTAIGRYAAQNLVRNGDFIIIEAGTTASSMVPYLQAENLTVLTNGLLTSILAHQANIDLTLMCSGGVLIDTGAFTGPQSVDFFGNHRVHKAFLGASGLTIADGFTDPTPLYLPTKRAMMASADQVIIMMDSSKICARSLLQVASFDEVDKLVTDSGAPPEIMASLNEHGVDVHVVDL